MIGTGHSPSAALLLPYLLFLASPNAFFSLMTVLVQACLLKLLLMSPASLGLTALAACLAPHSFELTVFGAATPYYAPYEAA
jgi:hypothetical protein